MPNSALPDRLNPQKTPGAWKNTDWDTWYQRWMIPLKGWFAYGPRATQRWARWRELPLLLAAKTGNGFPRFEYSDGTIESVFQLDGFYFSRCQKWCKWSVQLQWPLFFAAHYGEGDKPWFFYIGAARDADKVYWFPSVYFGNRWK